MLDLGELKICFLAGTLGQGGAERQLYYMLKTLRQAGADPHVLCLNQGDFWEEKIRELGVPVTWVGQHASKLFRLARIVRELRRYRFDVLQSQHLYTNLYATTAARLLGLREVGAIRNDTISEARSIGLMGPLSIQIPRVVATNSRAAIDKAMKLGVPNARLYFLPNVIDTHQFKPVPQRKNGVIRFLAVGRFMKQKRFDRFLSILARVRQEASETVKGTLIGDGPLRERLEQQATEVDLLPQSLEFRGRVSDMPAIYQEGDILVLTSDWEGTPNVILEAMASGLPVVATRVGGVSEIVQEGETGYLIDLGDEDAMVEALLKLSSNSHLRQTLGRRAREYVETHHSLCRLPAYLEELYRMALS